MKLAVLVTLWKTLAVPCMLAAASLWIVALMLIPLSLPSRVLHGLIRSRVPRKTDGPAAMLIMPPPVTRLRRELDLTWEWDRLLS